MKRWALAFAAAAFVALFLGPFGWQLLTSFWPEAELGGLWPSRFTLENHAAVVTDGPFRRAILNSFLVALGTTAVCLSVGAAASFVLAKIPLPGARLVLLFSLALSMFPPIATVSPLFLLLRTLGLRDSLWGLILTDSAFALPLALWTLTSFFREIPDELYRAARMDGCTPFGAFRHVLLPLVAPGLVTTGLLVFIFAWNEFLYALTFVSTPSKRVLPVAIGMFATDFKEPWAKIAAASVVATLPLVVLTLVFQKRIVSGLTAGAVKE